MTSSADTIEVKLALAERVLGHTFSDRDLLRIALTHPSAVEGRDPSAYYERLEFLGDAVLGYLVADEAYRRYPDMDEGGMTKIRIGVVSRETLGRVAGELGLSDAIIVGESMRNTANRGMRSALGNVFEALVAALYMDAGLEAARHFALDTLGDLICESTATIGSNPKSDLQELLQARGVSPTYRTVTQSGPPHDRTFTVVVETGDQTLGEGCGRTKREAEAAAAHAALERLRA